MDRFTYDITDANPFIRLLSSTTSQPHMACLYGKFSLGPSVACLCVGDSSPSLTGGPSHRYHYSSTSAGAPCSQRSGSTCTWRSGHMGSALARSETTDDDKP